MMYMNHDLDEIYWTTFIKLVSKKVPVAEANIKALERIKAVL